MAFDQTTRNRLQRFVTEARALLANEFTRQLQATYGMNPKTGEVAAISALAGLTPSQQETAQLLRDTLDHYLASAEKGKEKARTTAALERIVREQAFTVLNRLAALRMSEARGFLTESLAKGYQSKGFQLFHNLAGISLGESGDAYRHYLYCLFDEFSLDLSVLFDRFSAQGRLFPSTSELLKLLALINDEGIAPLWAEDETIGWIYQYFNSIEERKKMRAESQAPRNSRELAVRNQFFTPRYVVEFLTDNTLGRIWYEMTQGDTTLKTRCKYLVRRPNEYFLASAEVAPEHEENLDLSQEELLQQTVYIEYRKLKDPRDIRMLDPACGSMHFGLYAFDLYEAIYNEAWDIEVSQGSEVFIRENGKMPLTREYSDKSEFLVDVPRLIIENNIHGVDIDPRAVQIAGLSLWLRAHNSWQQAGIKSQSRPKIQRSNIVCAEPMPGEKALLEEFTATLKPTVLGQLVEIIFEKMELAGEAGSLLKIEQEIQDSIAEAKQVWLQQNQALSQFPDLVKVARQRGDIAFDVSDINDESFWEQAEQKILDALADYAQSATTVESGQKRLFAEDAAKGFAFIELCRKRFDVVLMNPPFGEPVDKVKAYLKSSYKNQVQDLYCLFVERAVTQNTNCSVGALTSSSFLKYNEYSAYRYFLLESECLDYLADLGWEVLDNAYVSASAYYFTSYRRRPSLFSDLRAQTEKSNLLLGDVSACFKGIISPSLFAKYSKTFLDIASNPFCYSFSVDFFKWVKNSKKIADITSNNGIGAGPHNFFFRLHWEVNKNDKVKQSRWPKLVNGGSFSPYYRSVNLLIDWRYDGEFIKEHLRKKYPYLKGNVGIKIQRENCYYKPGITYGKKTDRFNAQIMPDGCFPSFEGIGVYPVNESDTWWILAYLNSRFVAYYLNLTSGLHKNSIYLDRLPVPEFSECDKERLSSISKKIFSLVSDKLSLFETDNNYSGEKIPEYISKFESIDGFLLSFYKTEYEILKLVMDSEEIINTSIPLSSSLLADMLEDQGAIIGNDENTLCKRPVINFGKAFGTSELFTDNSSSMTDASLLDYLDKYRPSESKKIWFSNYIISCCVGYIFGTWSADNDEINTEFTIFNSDELDNKSLPSRLSAALTKHFDKSFITEDSLLSYLGAISLASHLTKSKSFFDFHYKEYSLSGRNAPIYWPLQSISGSYTLWVYYHQLNKETLYNCINNFVEKKLNSISTDVTNLRNKTLRSQQDEKELDRLTDFKIELEDYREELLRIAKFWRPNLNDGVQITAAPLWRLFQHKAWQEKLKETWEKLEEGEYDWAHLAYSVWPARVLRKCHQNLSLAIAHEVENELWHEVEVIKPRKKLPVWEWQPKPLSEAQLNAYIQNKIQALGIVA